MKIKVLFKAFQLTNCGNDGCDITSLLHECLKNISAFISHILGWGGCIVNWSLCYHYKKYDFYANMAYYCLIQRKKSRLTTVMKMKSYIIFSWTFWIHHCTQWFYIWFRPSKDSKYCPYMMCNLYCPISSFVYATKWWKYHPMANPSITSKKMHDLMFMAEWQLRRQHYVISPHHMVLRSFFLCIWHWWFMFA